MGDPDGGIGVTPAKSVVGRDAPLKRFRLGRYVLMLVFAFTAVAYVAPAVTGVVVAVDAAGEPQVNLRRMTEGGSPAEGPLVAYGAFLLIVAVSVALVAAAAAAAFLFLGDRVRPSAWAVLAAVGIAGAGGALVALAIETSEVWLYLLSIAVCFVLLTMASLFELWRARWVEGQRAASSADGPRPA